MSKTVDANKLKVLIVEDLHAETESLLRELRDADMAFVHTVVTNEKDFDSALSTFDADVILSPYSLSGTNAIKLLGITRKHDVDIPFILLAFDLSEDIAIDLLAEGIEDYILRSTIKRLPVAIRKALQRYKTQLELRISETRLRQSENSLKEAQQIAKVGSWEWDLEADSMQVSDELFRIYGVPPQPLSMKRILDFVHEEDRDKITKHIDQLATGKFVDNLEYRAVTPEGEEKYLKANAKRVADGSGKITRLIGTVQDITDRKKIELQLVNSKGMLAIGEQVANSGSFEVNLKTKETVWSENLYRITGLDETTKLNYENFIKCVHPEDRENYKQAFSTAVKTRKGAPFTFRFKRPDNGEVIYLQSNGKMQTRNGNDSVWIGNIQDITDRVLTQTELVRSQASLEAAQRIAKIGSWEWNPEQKKIWWSEEMFRIYEIKHQDVTLDLVKSFIHPDDRNTVDLLAAKDLTENINPVIEYRIITGKGNVKHVISSAQQVQNANSQVIQLIGTLQDVTEKVEETQKQQQQRLQRDLSLQAAQIGVWKWSFVEDELSWDERCVEVFGFGKDTFPIEEFYGVVHPDDQESVREKVNLALVNGSYRAEYRVSVNNEIKYIHARGELIKGKDGSPSGLHGVVIDMTSFHQTEVALRENERLFRDMAENITEVFWLTDWQLNEVLYVSPQYEKLYGMPTEELYRNSSSWSKAIHPEDRARITKAFREKAMKGTYDEEYRLLMEDGTIKWVRDRAFPVFDPSGNVSRVAGITENITEKKASQQQIETLSLVASETINGVLIHGPDGTVEWANRGFERITGYAPDQIIGKEPWSVLAAEETNQKLIDMTYEKVMAGKPFTSENQLRHKSGHLVWVSVTYSPVLDDFGNVSKVVSIGMDITKEKELQQLQKSMLKRLEKANIELKRKAEERSKNQ